MARYPVTILQFQAFLEDCYRDGRWRLPPGFPIDLPNDYRYDYIGFRVVCPSPIIDR